MRLTETDPARLRAFHIGGYWRGLNDAVRQMMSELRATGATVLEYSTDDHRDALDTDGRPYDRGTTSPVWLRWDRLESPLEAFDPHLVICNAGGLAFRSADAERVRSRRCLLGIVLSDPDVFEPTTRHIAPTFDALLTNAPVCVPRYRALGVHAAHLPAATNPEFFHPVPARPALMCDVLILGRAHPDRVEPARALATRFQTHIYGEGWEEYGLPSRGLIYGDDVLAALNSAKVTVVFNLTSGGHALVKGGVLDFPAAGALVATNRFAEVEPYMRFGEELIGFVSTADLVTKVRYYIDHPEEAATIRRAGRERVLRDHTWRRVWTRILPMLGHLPS